MARKIQVIFCVLVITCSLVQNSFSAVDPPAATEAVQEIGKLLQEIQTQQRKQTSYLDEIDRLEQLQEALDELKWVIRKNKAYIKDWQQNYNCLVAQKVADIFRVDRMHAVEKQNQIREEMKNIDPGIMPNLYEEFRQALDDISQTLQHMEKLEKEFQKNCAMESK